jgi:glutathione S-transferase
MVTVFAMKLFYTPNSPYARKVRIVLREKGIACEESQVVLPDATLDSLNSLGKVPTLLLDDQTSMFDSVVIVEVLELIKTEPRMIPIDLWERVIVRRCEATGDGLCDVLIPAVLEQRRAADKQDLSVIDRADRKVLATLKLLESELAGRTYAFGNDFTLADASLLTAFGYIALRRQHLLEGLAAVNAYRNYHAQRPSIVSTVPPG